MLFKDDVSIAEVNKVISNMKKIIWLLSNEKSVIKRTQHEAATFNIDDVKRRYENEL